MPCNKCTSSRNGRACVSADWSAAVLMASCDGLCESSRSTTTSLATNISVHRTLWYPLQAGGPWVSNQIPLLFDTVALLECLSSVQTSQNVRVTHLSAASYTINLQTCFNLLSQIKQQRFDLRQVFEKENLGASPLDWLKALREFDQGMTEVVRLF